MSTTTECINPEYQEQFKRVYAELEELRSWMRQDPDVDSEEFGLFLDFKYNYLTRIRLYDLYTNEMGHSTIYSAPHSDKQKLNELSGKIFAYERHLSGSPIFAKMAQRYEEDELPEFLKNVVRDDKGRFTETVVGWYQNSCGDLFHYDGVIWDSVPNEKIEDLEFLG